MGGDFDTSKEVKRTDGEGPEIIITGDWWAIVDNRKALPD